VWGHYHGGNLGDELVVATIVDAIRRRMPTARIVGVSVAPADTRERHGIAAYPINAGTPSARPTASISRSPAPRGRLRATARRVPGARRLHGLATLARKLVLEAPFLWRSYRMLRGIDLVVVAGSGQLLDEWKGPWLHPYTTFRWAMLARVARVPMLYPSVGAGPIESRLSAFFIRRAVATAHYVSVRDGHSGRVLESIGLAGPFSVCPDMGYGLSDEVLRPAIRASGERANGRVVGLNVMAHQDPRYWPRGDALRYEAFLRKMERFTRWLLDNGYSVRLFSSQARSDGRVASDLAGLLAESANLDPARFCSTMDEIEEVEDLVGVIGGCDVVVAARYHSVLLPLLLDIPVLGLAYNPKTTELLKDVGYPERCIDIDSFSVEALIDAFRDLCRQEEREAVEARRTRVAAHREAVEEQFERIFGRPREQMGLDAEMSAP
jgi:polysaccharide pyruvyl transferase WcaK-like protein